MITRVKVICLGLTLISFWGLTPPAANGAVTVVTESASGISGSDAILRGSVNPGGSLTKIWFEWGKGSKLNQVTIPQIVEGGFNTINFQALIYDLDFDTSYSYRAVARNANGIWYGETRHFTTEDKQAAFRRSHRPDVYTESTTEISYNRANVRGAIKLEGPDDPRRNANTEGWFEWGEDSSSLSRVTSRQLIGGDGYVIRFSDSLVGLYPNTTYYYRAVARNPADTARGEVMSFKTSNYAVNEEPFPPGVQVLPAEAIESRTAVLRGKVNPNYESTTTWFEWGKSAQILDNRTATQFIGNDNKLVDVNSEIDNLDPDSLYYYRVAAVNRLGVNKSSVEKFQTEEFEEAIARAAGGITPTLYLPSYSTIFNELFKGFKDIFSGEKNLTSRGEALTASALNNIGQLLGTRFFWLLVILAILSLGYRYVTLRISNRRRITRDTYYYKTLEPETTLNNQPPFPLAPPASPSQLPPNQSPPLTVF